MTVTMDEHDLRRFADAVVLEYPSGNWAGYLDAALAAELVPYWNAHADENQVLRAEPIHSGLGGNQQERTARTPPLDLAGLLRDSHAWMMAASGLDLRAVEARLRLPKVQKQSAPVGTWHDAQALLAHCRAAIDLLKRTHPFVDSQSSIEATRVRAHALRDEIRTFLLSVTDET